jgi:sulfur carrier protein ThiS
MYANKDEIIFNDIFDRENVVSYDEAYEAVLPVIKEMSQKIANAIIIENKKPPSAVVAVGGGCRLPDLEAHLAEALDICKNRVAVRDRSAIAGLECDLDILSGPESITPFGIAVSGARSEGFYRDYIAVRLNKKSVRLSDLKEHTISDVLLAAAFKPDRLAGKPGNPLSFNINGVQKTIGGGAGHPALIRVNGKPAGLDTVIGFGDDINIMDAEDGYDARVFVSDLAPQVDAGTVTCDGVEYFIAPRASINGLDCALSAEVRDGDYVELTTQTTVRMFIDDYLRGNAGAVYTVNGIKVDGGHVLSPGDEIAVINGGDAEAPEDGFRPQLTGTGEPAAPQDAITPQPPQDEITPAATRDNITPAPQQDDTPAPQRDDIPAPQQDDTPAPQDDITPHPPQDDITPATPQDVIPLSLRDDSEYRTYSFVINGELMDISSNSPNLLLVDAINYIVFERTDGQGRLLLRINDAPAKLTDAIHPGDHIAINWVNDNPDVR